MAIELFDAFVVFFWFAIDFKYCKEYGLPNIIQNWLAMDN